MQEASNNQTQYYEVEDEQANLEDLSVQDVETRRILAGAHFVPATCAELIRSAHAPEAVAATRHELIIALRTEMKIALHMRAAGRARRNLRLAQQEVKHRADAARHHQANHHPEADAHSPPRSVFAHVAQHQAIQRSQQSPGKIEIDA